jgi:archaellum component FlaF (FlaF/FlaG flagellin family)
MDSTDKSALVVMISLAAVILISMFLLLGIVRVFICDSGCQIDRRNDKLYECVNVNRMSEETCLEIVSP